MSFKIHLLIVSVIIAVVYVAQLLMPTPPPPVAPTAPTVQTISEFNISIIRASWGLNCRMPNQSSDGSNAYKQSNEANQNKIRENNVLSPVSELCNGKATCTIPVETSALGEDPLPTCMTKQLQVEYRCFSFDRLWVSKTSSGTIVIDCDKQAQ